MANLPSRDLRPDFNASIFDTRTLPGTQPRTLHGIDDLASSSITDRRASFRIPCLIEWMIRSNSRTGIGINRRGRI